MAEGAASWQTTERKKTPRHRNRVAAGEEQAPPFRHGQARRLIDKFGDNKQVLDHEARNPQR